MTQVSRFWDGTTVGDAAAAGGAPYDATNEFARVMQSVSGGGGIATNLGGVFRGELNELAVTGAATPVSINTGRGISAGTWYENDAATTIAIPTPAASTRVDVIVMRKDWTAQTVRLVRVAGVEGAGVPAITQIYGTTWDTPLANASITTGGVITLTDRRQFLGAGPMVNIRTFAVGDLLYADTTTTLTKLAIGTVNFVLTSTGTAPQWSSSLTLAGLLFNANTAITRTTGDGSDDGFLQIGGGGGASHTRGAYFTLYGNENGGGTGRMVFVAGDVSGGTIDFYTGTAVLAGTISRTGVYSATTAVAIGTNPAASGALRLAYLAGVFARNSTNTADGIVFSVIGAADIQFGGATFTNVNIPNAGQFRVGTSTNNTFMTNGITIQQGGADNEILAFKSTDVAQGMTSIAEGDTFTVFQKQTAASGGLMIWGLTSASIGIELRGAITTDNTTKTTGGTGHTHINSWTKSLTNVGAPGATANICTIASGNSTRFIFQADGTSYEDVGTAWTNYDDHDDVALLTDLSIAASRSDDAIHRRFASFLRYSPDMLEAMDLIVFNADGHHFANRSKIQHLLIGASRQNREHIDSVEQRVEALETENRELRELLEARS